MKPLEPIENLFQVIYCLTFGQLAFLLTVLLKVSTVTELCYDEYVVTRTEWVHELDHVLIFYLLKDFDLCLDQLL